MALLDSSMSCGREALPIPVEDVGTSSLTFSFGWVLANGGMTLHVDGFYYDHDRVKYTRHGDPKHYTFQQATSSMEDTSPVRQVPSPVVDVMVAAGLQYADP